MTAIERGHELMRVPTGKLPPAALDFARHLFRQMGGCMEVYLTAYAVYAQVVEGLPCDDELYMANSSHEKWFAERLLQDEVDQPVIVEGG